MEINHRIFLYRNSTEEPFKIYWGNEFGDKLKHFFGLKSKLEIPILGNFKRADTKTNEQLGYYFSEVVLKAMIAYRLLGWKVETIHQADHLLKKHCGYVEEIINEETGQIEVFVKSKEQFKIDEMSHLIDYAIMEVCATAGVEVLPPKTKT